MGSKIIAYLLIAFLKLSAVAFAWNEPDNFMGIKFGVDLRKSLPKCKQFFLPPSPEPFDAIDDRVCWRFRSKSRPYEIVNASITGNRSVEIDAYQVDSKLAKLFIQYYYDFRLIFNIFRERYGDPTTVKTKIWRSQGGGSFSSQSVEWIGKNISIYLEERDLSVDRGSITYETPAWREYDAKKKREIVKERAKKL